MSQSPRSTSKLFVHVRVLLLSSLALPVCFLACVDLSKPADVQVCEKSPFGCSDDPNEQWTGNRDGGLPEVQDAADLAQDIALAPDLLGASGSGGKGVGGAGGKSGLDGASFKDTRMDSTGVDSDPYDGNSGLEPRDTAPDKGDTPPGEVPSASGGAPGSGGATGTGGRRGTGGIIGTGGVTGTGGSVSQPVKLDGTKFGTQPSWNNNPGVTFDKAFDGNTATFFDDSHANDGYTGIDLGAPATVVSLRYYPRPGCNPPENCTNRMVGGKFQCSTTSQTTGYTDLYTIPSAPAVAWTEAKLAQPATCRYLRYLGPPKGYTNVAEIEFWGRPGN